MTLFSTSKTVAGVLIVFLAFIIFFSMIDVRSSQTQRQIKGPAPGFGYKLKYKSKKLLKVNQINRNENISFTPPDIDTNCLRKIPSQWTGQTGEASIVIPPMDVLDGMKSEVVACIFQRYVTSLQRHCSQPEMIGSLHKIGRPGVGGWNICLDQKYRPSDPCLVYSFSSRYQDYSFALQMTERFQCEVHKFDKSNTKPNDKAFLFNHNLWIGTSNNKEQKTLSYIMDSLGHRERILDVLTLDIEGEEWDLFEELITSGVLSRIQQISVAIHGPKEGDNKKAYSDRLRVLKLLYEKGLRLFWTNRDWDAKFIRHPKRTSVHILNLMQDLDLKSPQHLVPPTEELVKSMSPRQIGDFFHRYCMSMQILCRELVRMGNMNNGGWDVCHDKEWRPKPPCLVYSFGINFDFSFDDEIAEFYGCEVHSFDPSMKRKDYKQAPNVYFHDVGISDSNIDDAGSKWRLRTLQTFKDVLGHKNRHLDVLKLDVEFAEWTSVTEMIKSGTLKNVTQFYLEIHTNIVPDSDPKLKEGLTLLRSLYEEGFRIFWSHRNRHCIYIARDSEKEREACYEIHFLNIHHKRV